jgi:hypothetical protein
MLQPPRFRRLDVNLTVTADRVSVANRCDNLRIFRIAVKFFRDFCRCTGNLHLLRPFKRNATYFQLKQVEFH